MSFRQAIPVCPAARRPVAACLLRAAGPGGLLALLLVLPPPADAQQWFWTPEVEIGVQHVDNPRLTENGDTDSVTGGLLDLGLALHRNTPTTTVVVRPSVALHRYGGDSDEDSESYFLDFDAENQGQRSNWRLGGNFRRQQVFRGEITSAEFDDIGVDEDVQTGTGRTFVRRERDMLRLGPGFTYDITQRTSFKADVNYLNVQYDTQALGEAIDYTNIRADAAVVRALTPDSNIEFGLFASKYDPDGLRRETESVGARLRYEKEVSDISSFFIDVGAQDSDIQSLDPDQSDTSETSLLWNVGYSRQLERTRWRFDVGQAVTPSGSGAMVERDLYRASMRHQLRPRLSLRISAVLLNTDALGTENGFSSLDRDYFRTEASLGYEMTRTWTVEGRYSLTHQDFADIPGDAQEHEIRLSLVYRRPVPTS